MMTTATLPGMPPPRTRDYYARLPIRLLDDDRLTLSDIRVYRQVLKHSDPDGACRAGTAEIAWALKLDKGTVNRSLGRLRRLHPPGLDHPYIEVRGGTHSREIWPRYTPLEKGEHPSSVRSKRARNCVHVISANASNSSRKSNDSKRVAESPVVFEPKTKENDNESLSFGEPPPRTHATHAHARATAGPPPSPPAAPTPRGPARSADVLARINALVARLAAEEAGSPDPAPVRGASEPLTPEIAAARMLAEARPVDEGPSPAAGYSQGMPRAAGRRDNRTAALVHALYRSEGDPAAVGELVRHVAFRFQAVKPETKACWTQGFGEAVAWLEEDELTRIIDMAGSPRVEPYKRSRYLSRALCDRLIRAKGAAPLHRRE